jgi:hypothetical protein
MKKAILGLALTVAAAAGVVSTSQAVTTFEVTASGSGKPGTSKAPVPFTNAKFQFTSFESNGPSFRQAKPLTYEWWWEGVQIGGKGFPVCTAAEIDAAQSDASCPKASLIGQVTQLEARLGPEGDQSQFVDCLGKDIRFYNGGPNSIVWFIVGPGERCAGVTYFPPFNTNLRKVGNSTHVTVPLPANVNSPLPGVEGGLTSLPTAYFNTSIKVKAKKGQKPKKVSYVRSVACKGTREFNFILVDTEGTKTDSTSAGKCAASKKKKKKKK